MASRACRMERRACGLCEYCGNAPATRGGYCCECFEHAKERVRKSRGHKEWRPGSKGKIPYDTTEHERSEHARIVGRTP